MHLGSLLNISVVPGDISAALIVSKPRYIYRSRFRPVEFISRGRVYFFSINLPDHTRSVLGAGYDGRDKKTRRDSLAPGRKRWNRHFRGRELSRISIQACTVPFLAFALSFFSRDKCWHRYIAPRVTTRLFSTSMCSKTNVPIDTAMHRISLCGSLVLLTARSVSTRIFLSLPRDLRPRTLVLLLSFSFE